MQPPRTGVLVLRVWREIPGPDGLRVRVLSTLDVEREAARAEAVATAAAAVALVRDWLERFEHGE